VLLLPCSLLGTPPPVAGWRTPPPAPERLQTGLIFFTLLDQNSDGAQCEVVDPSKGGVAMPSIVGIHVGKVGSAM
jgi:hypothetical protein